MIIQSLVRRYEDTADVNPGWQKRTVSYALDISESGELYNIIPIGGDERRMTLVLPEAAGRSGKKAYETAYFLCDDGEYMLGLDPKKFQSAQKLHTELLSNCRSTAARAIIAYFSSGAPTHSKEMKNDGKPDHYKIQTAKGDVILTEKEMTGAKFIFMVNGVRVDYTDGDSEIVKAWSSRQSERTDADSELCLVTGEYDTIARVQYKVSLKGVTMSAQPLISMNDQTSFRSYGSVPKDPAAQIGQKAAFAYATALNDLLTHEKHHPSLGGDTIVYWAEGKDDAEAQMFSFLATPKEDDATRLDAIINNVASGRYVSLDGVVWDKRFYILCLSPNAARISVRFFHVSNFGSIVKKITQHYAALEIDSSRNEKFKYL
ncbi:MAG: type I-C CRISPR-associated protein Cas8c/Csd1, partial [Oscillospiraceae bacterium]|nr:type I-C CRISPR-associated protein Cas8c/Csd1 [Oscillospiraceae bacterium]